MKNIDNKVVETIRVLSADAIEKAKSGHPGLPLGCAPMAYTLWSKFLKHNPANSHWEDRDRFVLSAGHGSMLIYSLLHLFGYDVTMEDLKSFRQLGSRAAGHPEYGHTDGVETTTGPLGQGIANAVGMAIAEEFLASKFNRESYDIVNHYTYAIVGDGCLMEGISGEASSLAGTLGLGKLIVLYDSNSISIEGDTDIAFREDAAKRYEAYGWQVIKVADGNDMEAVARAIEEAKMEKNKPSFIQVTNIIGYGVPKKQGLASAHGEPLGADNVQEFKELMGWDIEEFTVPEEVLEEMNSFREKAQEKEDQWKALFNDYKNNYPALAEEYEKWFSNEAPLEELDSEDFWSFDKPMATRESSGVIINRLAKILPNLIGGSADLAPSTKTYMKDKGDFSADNREGANLHFGVREHAMAAIGNGICLHGGLRTYVSTFFVFSDYMKGAMRLSALMGIPVTYVLTHDSIGVGEDGPTHQPVEQLPSLRSTPNMTVFRPCDSKETAAGWYLAMTKKDGPVSLVLTRQKLPLYDATGKEALKGAYIIRKESKETPDILLMASGSEVELIYKAAEDLENKGVSARVISMPSMELFNSQSEEYKESIMPRSVRRRLAVEAGSSFGWYRYIGLDGDIIALDEFGASGKAEEVFIEKGFTVDNVVNRALNLLK
ncbi:transketolase [Alloiococcus sp. CFN-8]|uniref:transketolase n=1 Tax=Alloiococcus sp. CFN-8 TaxID=3416081 RepID=UPI003CEDBF8F